MNLIKLVKNYDFIFLDIDDTIFNYSLAHKMALENTFDKYNISEKEYNLAKNEIKCRDLQANHHKKELYFKVLGENNGFSLSKILSIIENYESIFIKNLKVDKNMFYILKHSKLSNKKIVAITNFYLMNQLNKLRQTGFIDLIDFIVTSEEYEIEKPNKNLINRALELVNNPDKSKVIMFGDSVVDDLSNLGIKYHAYNCSKLIIGVSGKSGAGKSVISKEIKDIFNAIIIEGDGYHKYNRTSSKWDSLTHYNPDANNLIKLSLDIKDLYHNISDIVSIPVYDHSDGMFKKNKEIKNRETDVIILDGLHSLYNEVTGDYIKIKIFINNDIADIQKIKRDTQNRGANLSKVTESINKRENDFNNYIQIQKNLSNFLININKDKEYEIIISDDLDFEAIMNGFTGFNIINDKLILKGKYDNLIKDIKKIFKNIKESRYVQ